MQHTPKTIASAATMVDPTGVPASMDIIIPESAHITDKTAEHIVTLLKLLKSFIADSAGKITSADMSSEPTRFMASTIITAVITAMIRLYAPAFVPVAFAKFSSNVTVKILL